MSSYRNACPAELYDDEDSDEYEELAKPRANPSSNFNCSGIKIIPKLGIEAGMNKSHFDIHLDVNSQAWFDRIYQYWRQCKRITNISELISNFFCFRQKVTSTVQCYTTVLLEQSKPFCLWLEVLRQRNRPFEPEKQFIRLRDPRRASQSQKEFHDRVATHLPGRQHEDGCFQLPQAKRTNISVQACR